MRSRAVKLLGVAAGGGASRPGAEGGPQALRELGLITRLERCGHILTDLGDIRGAYESDQTQPSFDINAFPNIVAVNRHVRDAVFSLMRTDGGAFPLIIGGDHSLAIGVLAGLADASGRLGVVWIDAHADFNTPLSSPSGNAHGMSLAVACGRGHFELRDIADKDPMVREEDAVILGARELDDGEVAALAASRVTVHDMASWRAAGVIAETLRLVDRLAHDCDHVHLSFDVDAIDAAAAPGTGTPVDGGLTPDEARALFTALSQQDKLHSIEFVEFNPSLDEDGRTGTLAIELLETLFTRLWPEPARRETPAR